MPFGPVIALWAWRGLGAPAAGGWAVIGRAAVAAVAVLTALEAVRHVRTEPRALLERASAYAAAGSAAQRWLGGTGLIAAEFPETLWFEDSLRTVSTTTPLENVQTAEAGLAATRRRLDPITRGCLLDTGLFPVSREMLAAFRTRQGAVTLPGLDERYVRAVCWPG